jgi:hypothetical protein
MPFSSTHLSARRAGELKQFAGKRGALNEVQESALPEELFELAHAVAAELFVVEIYGVPGPVARRNVIRRERSILSPPSVNSEPAFDPAFLWIACTCP